MGGSELLKKVEEVFSGWEDVEIEKDLDNAHIKLRGVDFAILHSRESAEVADVLRVPVFQMVFGERDVEEYKKALKELDKAGYRVKKYDFMGPNLLRTVI